MNIVTSITTSLAPVHREGYPFVLGAAAITLVLFLVGWNPAAWVGVVFTLWCAYFFRDPERVTPLRKGLVISPADGRISSISTVIPPPELDLPREPHVRISVFMNVFDVHVNRSPLEARLTRIAYVPGAFLNAELDKASEDNERQALTLELDDGTRIGVVQIAGLIARRIVKFVDEGERLNVGQRFGLIRFGSRVDVFLPTTVKPLACLGQRAIAGETVLADLTATEAQREGRKS
ncbi:phosphatidylserine decarboxylase [Aestuariivirga sp.]|uniref:phosphatidylserine decarboxylase n=1 Tax=Aestuariivirga sp. TaxID=2650926 RepID=UPI0039E34140